MARKKQGGANIRGVSGDLNVGGDIVGGDKYNENIQVETFAKEEKSGCAIALEKGVAFIFTLLIGGVVMGIFGALIIGGIITAISGSGGQEGWIIGAVFGVLLALGMAILNASSVKRYK